MRGKWGISRQREFDEACHATCAALVNSPERIHGPTTDTRTGRVAVFETRVAEKAIRREYTLRDSEMNIGRKDASPVAPSSAERREERIANVFEIRGCRKHDKAQELQSWTFMCQLFPADDCNFSAIRKLNYLLQHDANRLRPASLIRHPRSRCIHALLVSQLTDLLSRQIVDRPTYRIANSELSYIIHDVLCKEVYNLLLNAWLVIRKVASMLKSKFMYSDAVMPGIYPPGIIKTN
jgi:hypothetical protein